MITGIVFWGLASVLLAASFFKDRAKFSPDADRVIDAATDIKYLPGGFFDVFYCSFIKRNQIFNEENITHLFPRSIY